MQCGETWHRLASTDRRVSNLPTQPETWIGIQRLALDLLDPLVDHFGPLELTYAFAGPALTRNIKLRIAPTLDQHAGSELRKDGHLVCLRAGQAADFKVAGTTAAELEAFIALKVPFDRLYVYEGSDTVHCSVGPDHSRQIVHMIRAATGKLVPHVVRIAVRAPGTARSG